MGRFFKWCLIYVPRLIRFVTNRNKRSSGLRDSSYLSVADGRDRGLTPASQDWDTGVIPLSQQKQRKEAYAGI